MFDNSIPLCTLFYLSEKRNGNIFGEKGDVGEFGFKNKELIRRKALAGKGNMEGLRNLRQSYIWMD